MGDLIFEAPLNWISTRSCMPSTFFKLLERRNEDELQEPLFQQILKNTDIYNVRLDGSWYYEIFYVTVFQGQYEYPPYVDAVLASILIQALSVPRDCTRNLSFNQLYHGLSHNLHFFTNDRAIQVYCCHDALEKEAVEDLIDKDFLFRLLQLDNKLCGQNYENFTKSAFQRTLPSLAWECIFPEGIDMEALSPRDVNVHIKNKQSVPKAKPPVKLTQKEKDHPPPPPSEVREPPSSDRKHGAIYQTGKCLGKGGFAICYEGQLSGTKKRYALKIVKSYMPQKKMEQKVFVKDH